MKIIPVRVIMQAEPPDDYIDRVRRQVVEQIQQDTINRKKFWMDTLKSTIMMVIVFAFVVLLMCIMVVRGAV